MRSQRLLAIAVLAALVSAGSTVAPAQSQPAVLVGDGAIVAFHRQWRNPMTPVRQEMAEIGTRVDLWIVRVDRWVPGGPKREYFLVEYWLYERAVTDDEMRLPRLRFHFRQPRAIDGRACNGMTRVNSDPPFKYRPMRIDDFERTEPGRTDTITPLKDLPCLIVKEPPTVVKAQQG